MPTPTQHDELATRGQRVPAELRSFLKTSARYFGLADVPPELLQRHATVSSRGAGGGPEMIVNQGITQRGAA